MRQYLPYLFFVVIVTSSCRDKQQENSTQTSSEVVRSGDEEKYTLIRDNLYSDKSGNLYLKAVNTEDIENGTHYNVWLKTVYCDTCWTSTKNGWTDITELKDFVDVNSFHLDSTDKKKGGDIYKDKNYTYFHNWMADGGNITLMN